MRNLLKNGMCEGGRPTSEINDTRLHGVILRGVGSFYTILGDDGATYTLRCKKNFRHRRLTPLAGDEAFFVPGGGEEEDGWLEDIGPRRSGFIRPPVANVSLMLIVVAPEPEPDLVLADRMMAMCRMQEIRVALLVTKCDLDASLAERLREEYASAGCPVLAVSGQTGEGVEAVRDLMRGEICCLTGQSGVGKSTLLNRLLGTELETGEISRKISRGKNTTRKAELLCVDGLRVMDTAGFSLLEFGEVMDPVKLKEAYPEFAPLEGKCRFQPCYHDAEPDCAVRAAVRDGEIHPKRWARYRALLGEVRETWRNRYD